MVPSATFLKFVDTFKLLESDFMHHLECAKHFACRHEQKVAKIVQTAEPIVVRKKAKGEWFSKPLAF